VLDDDQRPPPDPVSGEGEDDSPERDGKSSK